MLATELLAGVASAYNVRSRLLAVDIPLHDTVLVDTNGGEDVERALVAGVDTVEDQAHDNLLPGRTTLVPELGLLQVDNIADVLHNTVKRSGRQNLVFVVIRDGDEQFGVAVVHGRAQIVTVLQREIVRVAGRSGIWIRVRQVGG